ncbi:DUF4386 domain-containing protein [Xanthomonas axonopodis pv. poinsettiicola]|uniref:DUF4386 domain-containing protein n=1 Tax=Xanthomonas TaxID=338 RepID=UPI001E65C6F4|nr:DUF4386 domain-containing protein [Xanthomonas codiaei]MCC8536966.1 DUF4386 domain-containing protein [Xanthomonas codiaei]
MAYDIQARPQFYARLAGALYLAVIVLGGLAEGYVANALIVPGDTHATIHAIVQHAQLWTLGLAANLLVPLIALVQLWIEYMLLRPAGKGLALLFVLLNLASLAVEAVSKVFQLMVLPLASGGVSAAEAKHASSLAALALLGHDIGFNIALLFFGAACLVSGTLIWRSRYLPRFVGGLMLLAALSYLVASFSALLAPAFAKLINPGILLPVLVGETTFCLWLLIRAVDRQQWDVRAAAM